MKSEKKIQEICDHIQESVLLPAKKEAESILQKARDQAEQIIFQAKEESTRILQEAKKKISQERHMAQASIEQGCRQAGEKLRQEIEESLFNPTLEESIHQELVDPETVAKLIAAVIRGMEREGLESDFSLLLSKELSADSIVSFLMQNMCRKLEKEKITLGKFSGGVQILWEEKKMKIDCSKEALQEMIAEYVREDFRHLLFQNS